MNKTKKQKHLFPVKEFKNKKGEKIIDDEKIPYAEIDLIFNSKNAWINFQNPNPKCIYFNIHREKQWYPIIRDKEFNIENESRPKTKDRSDSEDELLSKNSDERLKSNQENKSKAGDKNIENTAKQEDNDDEYFKLKSISEKKQIEVFKRKGTFLRDFAPFYELKSMIKMFSNDDIIKKTTDIVVTIEMGMKALRSAQNKNTKCKKDKRTLKKFERFLDTLEDEAAGRFIDSSQIK